MKKHLLLLFLISHVGLCLQAQVYKTVSCTAGELYDLLTAEERATVTNLTVTGAIDASDFLTMRDDMPVLAVVDLSGVAIAGNVVPAAAFYNVSSNTGKTTLTSVTLPSSITYIGKQAFRGCNNLTTCAVPSGVVTIGESAFCDCTGLTSVSIPSTVTNIMGDAFYNCSSLSTLTIANGVTTIGGSAFCNCSSLTSVVIPPSVTVIGDNAFRGCTSLTSLTFNEGLLTIGSWAFYGCNAVTSVTIPGTITSIGNHAFYNCTGLTTLTFTEGSNPGVATIGCAAFASCTGLTGTLTIPSSVSIIGDNNIYMDGTFQNCTGLAGLIISNGVTAIHCYSFRYCTGLTGTLMIPHTVTTIGRYAFENCFRITKLVLNEGLQTINQYAFSNCTGLKGTITIPSTVNSINWGAFNSCNKITSLIIPSSVGNIESEAFNSSGYSTIKVFHKTPLPLSAEVFNSVDKNACTLYVPFGSKTAYKVAAYWDQFANIVEMPGLIPSGPDVYLGTTAGSTTQLAISSNTAWTATPGNPWFTVSPASGTGDASLTLTATADLPSGSTYRNAYVTFTGDFSSDSVRVTQMSYPNNALAFDGIDDYVDCGTGFDLNNKSFSVAFWAKRLSADDYDLIVGQGCCGLHIGFRHANVFTFDFYGNTLDIAITNDANWHYWTCTYSSNTGIRAVYRDGVLVGSDITSAYSNSGSLTIGGAIGYYFNGHVDEVSIWSKDLTRSEILSGMWNGFTGAETGLLAYYTFNSGVAGEDNSKITALTDTTAHKRHGVLRNFALSAGGTASNWVAGYDDAGASTYVAPSISRNVFPRAGGTATLVLETNAPWAAAAGAPWLAVSPAAGLGTDTLTVTVSPLPAGEAPREAALALTGRFVGATLAVLQTDSVGNALAFDGADDYVDIGTIPASVDFSQGFTYTGWVRWSAFDRSYFSLFGLDDGSGGNSIYIRSDYYANNLCFLTRSGWDQAQVVTGRVLVPGKWTHVAATVSGAGEARVYIDGVLAASGIVHIPASTDRVNCYLGRSNWVDDAYFNGSMDEVSLWNRALSQAEVVSGMWNGFTGAETGLLAYYRFDQGIAGGNNVGVVTLPDSSSNGRHGVLRNFALSAGGTASNWVAGYDDAGVIPTLNATLSRRYVPAITNSEATVTITSNTPWTITPSETWLTLSSASGIGNATATVTVEALPAGVTAREAKLVVTGKNTSTTLRVKQTLLVENALAFDGADDYVDLGAIPATAGLSQGFTYTGWVRWNTFNNYSRLLDIGNGEWSNNIVLANLSNNNRLYIESLNYGGAELRVETGNVLTPGRWTHVAATVSGAGEARVYIDGVLAASGIVHIPASTDRVNCYLGRSNWVDDAYFNGSMDEVSLWNRALSQAEVVSGMWNGFTGAEPGLLAYYKFNQGVPEGANGGQTALADSSGNSRNGTLNNFDLTEGNTTSNWVEGYDENDVAVVLSPSPSALDVLVAGSVELTANTSWTATPSRDWLAVSPASGTGNATLTVTARPNRAEPTREALIQLAGRDGKTAAVAVTQALSPAPLSAVAGCQRVTLSWSQCGYPGFLNYRVYGGPGANPTAVVGATASGVPADTTLTITGLAGGTTYYFRVTAANADGTESAFSNEVSVETRGPIGYYPFSANADDASGNGRNGVVSGASLTTDRLGNDSSAYSFDGIDDYIDIGVLNPSKFTIGAWVKPNVIGSHQVIVSKLILEGGYEYRNFELRINVNGKVSLHSPAGSTWDEVASRASLSAGRWYHVAATCDGVNSAIYIDGELDTTASIPSGTYLGTESRAVIGARPSSYGAAESFFNGCIDEVSLYRRVLGPAEIDSLFRLGKGVYNISPASIRMVGTTATLSFSANAPWSIAPGDSWLSVSPASGIKGDSVTITAGELPEGVTTRASRLTITGDFPAVEVNVIQSRFLENALAFDGNDDYVDCGTGFDLNNKSFSVAFWAKRLSADDNDLIVGQGCCGLHIGFRSSNVFTFDFYGNTLDVAINNDANWHYWTCTYSFNTGLREIYRDGVMVGSDITSAYSNSGSLTIGAALGQHFNGQVDEVSIWSKVLTQSEIISGMWNGFHAAEPGLLGYYKFNQGTPEGDNRSVTALADSSGNSRNGTLYNFDLTEGNTTSNWVEGYEPSDVATLSLSQSEIVLPYNESFPTFDITTNTCWEVSSNQPWVVASPASGAGNATIQLYVAESVENRKATVNVISSTGLMQTVTVKQKSEQAVLISDFKVNNQIGVESIDAVGKTITINVRPKTDLKVLAPYSISVPAGATITPGVNEAQDFSLGAVTYTVTASDGETTQDWQVIIREGLTLTSLTGEANYSTGESVDITWRSYLTGSVILAAYSNGTLYENLDTLDITSGTYGWLVTNGLYGKYTVRLIWQGDPSVYVESGELTITDALAPGICGLVPANGAKNVPLTTPLAFRFDENVVKNAGTIGLYTSATNELVCTFDLGNVTLEGSRAISLALPSPLQFLTGYYLLIDPNSFADAYGNPFAGINSSSTWAFTTLANPDASITSSIYSVSQTDNTIHGVIHGTTPSELKAALTAAYGATIEIYKKDGVNIAEDLENGYLVIVTAQDGTTKRTYTVVILGYDATIASSLYSVDQANLTISTYSCESLTNFKSNLTVAQGASFRVLEADEVNEASNLGNGCKVVVTAEDGVHTKTYTVSLTSYQIVTCTPPAGEISLCQGVAQSGYTTTSNMAFDYTWQISPVDAGTIQGGGSSAVVSWNANFAGEAYIRVLGSYGACGADWAEQKVTMHPLPDAVTISGQQSVCMNQNYAQYSIEGNSGFSYEWEVSNGSIKSGQGTDRIYVNWGEQVGMALVSLKITSNATGCSTISQIAPIIEDQTAPDPPEIRRKGSINILMCSTANASSYTWYYNSEVIPGANEQFYVARNQAGLYQVEITVSNGCHTRSAELTVFNSGATPSVVVYPNPVTDMATIELQCDPVGLATITLLNSYGIEVDRFTLDKTDYQASKPIRLAGYPRGVYLVKVEMDGKIIDNQKVILQ